MEKRKKGSDVSKRGMDMGFPGGPVVKNLPCKAGDAGSIPGQGTMSHMPRTGAAKVNKYFFKKITKNPRTQNDY